MSPRLDIYSYELSYAPRNDNAVFAVSDVELEPSRLIFRRRFDIRLPEGD
jgi:hypothetical protein